MCNIVCRKELDAKTAKDFKEKIEDEYRVNMYGSIVGEYCHLNHPLLP